MQSDLAAVLARLDKITKGPYGIRRAKPHLVNGVHIVSGQTIVCRIPLAADKPIDQKEADAVALSLLPELIAVAKAAQSVKVMIGARLDDLSSAQRAAEVNRAWHVLDAALSALAQRGMG